MSARIRQTLRTAVARAFAPSRTAKLALSEHVFCADAIDRDEQNMVFHVHTINHEHSQLEHAQIALEPGTHLPLGGSPEPTAHGALARAARLDRGRRWPERAPVSMTGGSDEHLLDGPRGQGVLVSEVLPARQHDLAALHGALPGPADRASPAPQSQLARRVPIAICLAARLAGMGRAADGGPLILEEMLQGGHPRAHHEGVEVTPYDGSQPSCDRHSDGLSRTLPCYFLHRRVLDGMQLYHFDRAAWNLPLKLKQRPGLRQPENHARYGPLSVVCRPDDASALSVQQRAEARSKRLDKARPYRSTAGGESAWS